LASLPHDGGAEAKLNEDQLLLLADPVAKFPYATLEQLRDRLKKQARVEVSVPTIWRALDSLGLSRKKARSGRRSGPGRNWSHLLKRKNWRFWLATLA
jgi:transposase